MKELVKYKNKITIISNNDTPNLGGVITNSYSENIFPKVTISSLLFESESSNVYLTTQGDILKLLKIRHWSEYYKFFFGKNRAKEEVVSNLAMKSLGLKVPELICSGRFTEGYKKREYSSFYIMKSVPSNFKDGVPQFPKLADDGKKKFIDKFYLDLKKLKDSGYIYSDLSFRNVMIDDLGSYYWIDTRVKKYVMHKKYAKLYDYSLSRFITYYSSELGSEACKKLSSLLFSNVK